MVIYPSISLSDGQRTGYEGSARLGSGSPSPRRTFLDAIDAAAHFRLLAVLSGQMGRNDYPQLFGPPRRLTAPLLPVR
jgi:hypothetical protein